MIKLIIALSRRGTLLMYSSGEWCCGRWEYTLFFSVSFVVRTPHGGRDEDRSLEGWLNFDHTRRKVPLLWQR